MESGGLFDPWDEVSSLIHSDDGTESGDHVVVETDEEGRSLLRFGNGINGRRLPDGAAVHTRYQVGYGLEGNVGADTLVHFDRADFPEITGVWNPFDVTDGRAPEPVAEIIRRAPEAFRYHQLRAVTLKDYVDRAEALPGVAKAAARYMWTGSWRTVRLTIDPEGTTTFSDDLRTGLARHLDAVRLLGEDLELRPPRFVPLEITVTLCIHPDYWPEDVRFVLDQEFSSGYTPDGRRGFFHPDNWTFGQALHASELLGRIERVTGVDHVTGITMQRRNGSTPGTPETITVLPEEVVLVRNDPDHQEDGQITFYLDGRPLMSCENFCTTPPVFPAPIHNRPGLPRIAYRIGDYASIRAALMDGLSAHPVLRAWTHRLPDDPGIALLEGAAVLGDILTLYQEVYANEAYLRTAQWRESVDGLVRLLGYRLAPGLGGCGTFAFEVRGDAPVVIPEGFPVKAQLKATGDSAEFETTEALTAYPALDDFHLYRPQVSEDIDTGTRSFSVETTALTAPGSRSNPATGYSSPKL